MSDSPTPPAGSTSSPPSEGKDEDKNAEDQEKTLESLACEGSAQGTGDAPPGEEAQEKKGLGEHEASPEAPIEAKKDQPIISWRDEEKLVPLGRPPRMTPRTSPAGSPPIERRERGQKVESWRSPRPESPLDVRPPLRSPSGSPPIERREWGSWRSQQPQSPLEVHAPLRSPAGSPSLERRHREPWRSPRPEPPLDVFGPQGSPPIERRERELYRAPKPESPLDVSDPQKFPDGPPPIERKETGLYRAPRPEFVSDVFDPQRSPDRSPPIERDESELYRAPTPESASDVLDPQKSPDRSPPIERREIGLYRAPRPESASDVLDPQKSPDRSPIERKEIELYRAPRPEFVSDVFDPQRSPARSPPIERRERELYRAPTPESPLDVLDPQISSAGSPPIERREVELYRPPRPKSALDMHTPEGSPERQERFARPFSTRRRGSLSPKERATLPFGFGWALERRRSLSAPSHLCQEPTCPTSLHGLEMEGFRSRIIRRRDRASSTVGSGRVMVGSPERYYEEHGCTTPSPQRCTTPFGSPERRWDLPKRPTQSPRKQRASPRSEEGCWDLPKLPTPSPRRTRPPIGSPERFEDAAAGISIEPFQEYGPSTSSSPERRLDREEGRWHTIPKRSSRKQRKPRTQPSPVQQFWPEGRISLDTVRIVPFSDFVVPRNWEIQAFSRGTRKSSSSRRVPPDSERRRLSLEEPGPSRGFPQPDWESQDIPIDWDSFFAEAPAPPPAPSRGFPEQDWESHDLALALRQQEAQTSSGGEHSQPRQLCPDSSMGLFIPQETQRTAGSSRRHRRNRKAPTWVCSIGRPHVRRRVPATPQLFSIENIQKIEEQKSKKKAENPEAAEEEEEKQYGAWFLKKAPTDEGPRSPPEFQGETLGSMMIQSGIPAPPGEFYHFPQEGIDMPPDPSDLNQDEWPRRPPVGFPDPHLLPFRPGSKSWYPSREVHGIRSSQVPPDPYSTVKVPQKKKGRKARAQKGESQKKKDKEEEQPMPGPSTKPDPILADLGEGIVLVPASSTSGGENAERGRSRETLRAFMARRRRELSAIKEEYLADPYANASASNFITRGRTAVITDLEMLKHRCVWDSTYPEKPARLQTPLDSIRQQGLLQRCIQLSNDEIEDIAAKICSVHGEKHITRLKQICLTANQTTLEKESSNWDAIYFNSATYDSAIRAVTASIHLVRAVANRDVQNGIAIVRPPGHHAMHSEYNGYCFFNNVAIAAETALKEELAKKILIVDIDVHHGQGIQRHFYNRKDVLYVTFHRYEDGRFWPNLLEGNYHAIGTGAGTGYNINIPLNTTGLRDEDYLAIVFHILLPVGYEFNPDLVIVSAGYDAAIGCPEGRMNVTPGFYSHLINFLSGLARGQVAVVLEGGYFLPSLGEGVAQTLKSLLGGPCPVLEPIKSIHPTVVEVICNLRRMLHKRWGCFQLCEIARPDERPSQPEDHKFELTYLGEFVQPPFATRRCYPVNTDAEKFYFKKLIMALQEKYKGNNLPVVFIYDDLMLRHKPPEGERMPERPERLSAIMEKFEEFGITRRLRRIPIIRRDFSRYSPHTRHYMSTINTTEMMPSRDVYLNQDTNDTVLLAASGCLNIMDEIAAGRSRSGVAVIRPPGHHAEFNKPSGFCFVNNVALAANYLLIRHGYQKILIVDFDIHHGNGTQNMFYTSDQVMYISIHRDDNGKFFPANSPKHYTHDGYGPGKGFNINIPFSKDKMGDTEYMAAFHNIVLPAAYSFAPQIILVSAGFDAGIYDPLGNYKVNPETFGHMIHMLKGLAEGRMVVILEGGYNLTTTAYGMTICTKVLLGDPIPVPKNLYEHFSLDACETLRNVADHLKQYFDIFKCNKKLTYAPTLVKGFRRWTPDCHEQQTRLVLNPDLVHDVRYLEQQIKDLYG